MKKPDLYLERYFNEVLNKDNFFGKWADQFESSKEALSKDKEFRKWRFKESLKALKRGVKKWIGL